MKQRKILVVLVTMLVFTSCQKEKQELSGTGELVSSDKKPVLSNTTGYAYTLSNQVAGNSVLVYARSASGHLTPSGSYSTGGTGTGTGLGNQGAIILSDDYSWLLAVNPGSNTIASLHVSGGSLELKSTAPSGGITPISITRYGSWVYVLNAGGSGNISGFTLGADGVLTPLAGSTRPLSSGAAGPAQISFINDGSAVIVTEKMTNKIISYTINAMGLPGAMHSVNSANPTPFGCAVGSYGIIYVSEAAGGAPSASSVSSYQVNSSGEISLVDGPVLPGQTAACWVVLTNNEKYVYSTNTGSNNISSFCTDGAGGLDVLQAAAAPSNTLPIDAALSNNSKFLYVLNSGTDVITIFSVGSDGSLSPLQTVTGLPDGATGMAAK